MIERIYKRPYNEEQIQIEVEFSIIGNVQRTIDDLNRILHKKEPKKLSYNLLPGRYVMATLDGEVETDVFRHTERGVMKFIAETNYWLTDYGDADGPVFDADEDGVIHVSNGGTAPAYPEMAFEFPSDSGYLGVVAPNGYIELGKLDEADSVELDTRHRVVNEELHAEDMDDWDTVSDEKDLKGFINQGLGNLQPSHDKNGIVLKKSNSQESDGWNTFAFTRKFDEHEHMTPAEFNNYRLDSRITMQDLSDGHKGLGDFRVMILDDNNDVIMGVSIGQYKSGSPETTVNVHYGQINSGKSVLAKRFYFPNGFGGYVRMIKEGNEFNWRIDSQRSQRVATVQQGAEEFKIYNIVYLKNSATHYYHHNGARYAIPNFVRGRKHWISGSRMFNGKRQYEISHVNTKIAWVYDFDLTKNASGVGNTRREETIEANQVETFRRIDAELAGKVATKVMVVGGVPGTNNPPTGTNLSSVVIDRINNDIKFKDVKNTFNKGDILTINNKTNEILLNDMQYQGYIDPASRFFDIDFGDTDIQLVTSEWSEIPKARLQIEERWR